MQSMMSLNGRKYGIPNRAVITLQCFAEIWMGTDEVVRVYCDFY
jgi:hypothetical protein